MSALAFTLAELPWEPADANGTRSATLAGTRSSFFSYAYFLPAGVYDGPHSHPVDAHLVVASGCLRLGYGDSFSRDDTRAYPAGSFLRVPAGVVHFDGADEDTVLIGAAVGPWGTVAAPSGGTVA